MSTSVGILDILNSAERLYSVGYSTGYNFTAEKAADFFDDLVESSLIESPIFSGIMILEHTGKSVVVVDGIQRMTTLSLLLAAMCECFRDTSLKNEEAGSKVFKRYLTHGDETKLSVGEEDKIYGKIIFREIIQKNEKSNLLQTYRTFLKKIKTGQISPAKLFKIISRIRFLVVYSDNSGIDGRNLYQALNKNKNDLSQVNLISDFISQKSAAYGDNIAQEWQSIISMYKGLGLLNKLRAFIRDFLTIQNNGKIPSVEDLYTNFRMYFDTMMNFQPSSKIISNMCKYAKNYLKIIQSDFDDWEIKKMFVSINENEGQDSYSYLMEVLDDLDNNHIEKNVFIDILTMINNFVVNRRESGQEISEMKFANLSKELNKMLVSQGQETDNSDNWEIDEKITINKINNI